MSEAENAQPERNEEPSLIALAYRVLRGELTEAQAIEIAQGKILKELER